MSNSLGPCDFMAYYAIISSNRELKVLPLNMLCTTFTSSSKNPLLWLPLTSLPKFFKYFILRHVHTCFILTTYYFILWAICFHALLVVHNFFVCDRLSVIELFIIHYTQKYCNFIKIHTVIFYWFTLLPFKSKLLCRIMQTKLFKLPSVFAY